MGIVAVMVSFGCGDPEVVDDSGTDAGDSALPPPSPAQIPWLAEGRPPVAPPQMTPCPAGWSEVEVDALDDDVTRCTPYPAGAPDECTRVDEAQLIVPMNGLELAPGRS